MSEVNLALAVLALAVGTYAFRLGGVAFGGSSFAIRLEQWSDQAVIVLLASVAATSTLYDGQDFAGWARIAGVATAALLAVIRAPLVFVVLAAAAVTGCLRGLGLH